MLSHVWENEIAIENQIEIEIETPREFQFQAMFEIIGVLVEIGRMEIGKELEIEILYFSLALLPSSYHWSIGAIETEEKTSRKLVFSSGSDPF